MERWIARRRLLRRVELQRLEELRSRYFPDRSPLPYEAPHKYLEISRALDVNLRRAQHLGLLRDCPPGRPRRVLDLGCGAGLFLFICKVHGYECLGLDVGDVPLYDDFLEILGVERVDARIEAFGRLPQFERPFDYITAFGTVFNRNQANRWWSEREWEYFLNDVDRHLAPGGRLYLEPNPMGGPAHNQRWRSRYTPEILRAFMGRGAVVDRYGALFPAKAAPEDFSMAVERAAGLLATRRNPPSERLAVSAEARFREDIPWGLHPPEVASDRSSSPGTASTCASSLPPRPHVRGSPERGQPPARRGKSTSRLAPGPAVAAPSRANPG